MYVTIDGAKKYRVAMFCSGYGDILRNSSPVSFSVIQLRYSFHAKYVIGHYYAERAGIDAAGALHHIICRGIKHGQKKMLSCRCQLVGIDRFILDNYKINDGEVSCLNRQ